MSCLAFISTKHPFTSHYRTCRFSQFLNLESSFPNNHVNICRAFILARTTPRLLYQCAEPSLSERCACTSLSRIWFRIPTSSSSTLWLIPTEISMNLARYVHARHLPSETNMRYPLSCWNKQNLCLTRF